MSAADLRAAMRQAGLCYAGPLLPDGRLHRFRAEGDHAPNSWYVLHPGPPAAGAYGCWKRGISETWCDRAAVRTQADWTAVQQRWADADRERDRVAARARQLAERLCARARPAGATHPYLARKEVGVLGDLLESGGKLLAPLRDAEGRLHSIQVINADGNKRFLTGGRVAGCSHVVCARQDGPLVICEGYATGASIHKATGWAVVCAMSAGNLLAVAQALRRKWPERQIILAGDNDAWTPGNPGVTHAAEAARVVHANLAVPEFLNTENKPTDFNDLYHLEGHKIVKEQIQKADAPKETDEQAFGRLATLAPADYDRAREAEAKRLGIRAATLDAAVAQRRPSAKDTNNPQLRGRELDLADVVPWPEPVDGAAVLGDVAAYLSRYVSLPPGAADAIALWVAHTYCYDLSEHTPRLHLTSPERRCGKTLLLDLVSTLVPRPLQSESLSVAALFRVVEDKSPTLLLDECDAWLRDNEDLRGLLNAGHRRGGQAIRCVGEDFEPRAFAVFAPVALSGIGGLPGTLADRSIRIRLTRAKHGEVAERYDSRRADHTMARKLARWTDDHSTALTASDPAMPSSAYNRVADNWRPLFGVAEAAGGDWLARATAAYAALTVGDMDAEGIGSMLLSDIRDIFGACGHNRLASADLAVRLAGMEGRPWPEYGRSRRPISPNQIASLLWGFRIRPGTIRLADGGTAKGYYSEQFEDVFGRYLGHPPSADRHTVTNTAGTGDLPLFHPSHAESLLRSGTTTNPQRAADCDVVTDPKGGNGLVEECG